MSREIPLTQGLVTVVDDTDYDQLAVHKWCAQRIGKKIYAVRTVRRGGRRHIYMHRDILGLERGEIGDHVTGDTLDNRRANLRKATPSQNMMNKKPWGQCGYKGVEIAGLKFTARIKLNGKRSYLGIFDTPDEAARAYDLAASRLFGEFARLNFPAAAELEE